MENLIYEELDVIAISRDKDNYCFSEVSKKVISEIALKIIVNNEELVSLLCLNQYQEELALGFLYNEGVINSYEDVKSIEYIDRMLAVSIILVEGIQINRSESLRSVTSGCGRCFTYINPLRKNQYEAIGGDESISVSIIIDKMKNFINKSEIFTTIGGVHSALFYSPDKEIFIEDIGRHNCFDKITGLLLKTNLIHIGERGMIIVSGRISSEIVTKLVRTKVPILVSRSTPTTSAIKLAEEFNITLLGYVRGDKGFIYTCSHRIRM